MTILKKEKEDFIPLTRAISPTLAIATLKIPNFVPVNFSFASRSRASRCWTAVACLLGGVRSPSYPSMPVPVSIALLILLPDISPTSFHSVLISF